MKHFVVFPVLFVLFLSSPPPPHRALDDGVQQDVKAEVLLQQADERILVRPSGEFCSSLPVSSSPCSYLVWGKNLA